MKPNSKRSSLTNPQISVPLTKSPNLSQSLLAPKNLKLEQLTPSKSSRGKPQPYVQQQQKLLENYIPRANLDLSSQQNFQGSLPCSGEIASQQSLTCLSNQSLCGSFKNGNSQISSIQLGTAKQRTSSTSKIQKGFENGLYNNQNGGDQLLIQQYSAPQSQEEIQQKSNFDEAIANLQAQGQHKQSYTTYNSPINNSLTSPCIGGFGLTANLLEEQNHSYQADFGVIGSQVPLYMSQSLNQTQQISIQNLSIQNLTSSYCNMNSQYPSASLILSPESQSNLEQVNKQILVSNYKQAIKLIESHPISIDDFNGFKDKLTNSMFIHSLAMRADSVSFFKFLEQHFPSVDFNIPNQMGWTPLMLASMKQQMKEGVIKNNSNQNINFNSLEIDKINFNSSDVLIIFIFRGNFDVVRYLISNKSVNINSQDQSGNSALHIACMYSHRKIVEMLLGYKQVQSNIRNNEDKSPKDIATDSKILQLFAKFRKVNLDQSISSQSTLSMTLNTSINNNTLIKESPRRLSRSRQNPLSGLSSQYNSGMSQRSHSNSIYSQSVQNLSMLSSAQPKQYNQSKTKNSFFSLKQSMQQQSNLNSSVSCLNATTQSHSNITNTNLSKQSQNNSPSVRARNSPNSIQSKVPISSFAQAASQLGASNYYSQGGQSPSEILIKGRSNFKQNYDINNDFSTVQSGENNIAFNQVNGSHGVSSFSESMNTLMQSQPLQKNQIQQNGNASYLLSENSMRNYQASSQNVPLLSSQSVNFSSNTLASKKNNNMIAQTNNNNHNLITIRGQNPSTDQQNKYNNYLEFEDREFNFQAGMIESKFAPTSTSTQKMNEQQLTQKININQLQNQNSGWNSPIIGGESDILEKESPLPNGSNIASPFKAQILSSNSKVNNNNPQSHLNTISMILESKQRSRSQNQNSSKNKTLAQASSPSSHQSPTFPQRHLQDTKTPAFQALTQSQQTGSYSTASSSKLCSVDKAPENNNKGSSDSNESGRNSNVPNSPMLSYSLKAQVSNGNSQPFSGSKGQQQFANSTLSLSSLKLKQTQSQLPLYSQGHVETIIKQNNLASLRSLDSIITQIPEVVYPTQQQGMEIYSILSHLGSGNYGNVYLVENRRNRKKYAMKLLDKEKLLSKNMLKYAIAERNVMQKCNSPFIVKMFHSFQTETHLSIVMEYCPGGELYSSLLQKKKFDEDLAIKYLSEILLAVEELHFHDVVYRDMKPENIVLGNDGHVKLIDFGLSKENIGEGAAQSFCGSAVYLAPEIISKKGHNKSVDWYQFGVLTYELLVGQPPFNQLNRKELYFHIQNKKVEYPSFLSSKAKSLISALLNKNPEERLGSGRADAQQIKDHPFFGSVNWFDVLQKVFEMPLPSFSQSRKDSSTEIKMPQNQLKEPLNVQQWYYFNQQELS